MFIPPIILILYGVLVLIWPDGWWLLYAASQQTHIDKVERTQELETRRKIGAVAAILVAVLYSIVVLIVIR